MSGLTLGWMLGLGLPLLAAHWTATALSRALRAYSRSLLEEVCEARGRPRRADEIAHWDEKTERACEVLAVLSGLLVAALLGALIARAFPGRPGEAVVGVALVLSVIGYVAAGVLGRAYAEAVLDACWPVVVLVRRLMTPATSLALALEEVIYRHSRPKGNGSRPASVEVELHHSGHEDDPDEADLPESTREMLERAVDLARRDVSEIMTPRSKLIELPAGISAREAARSFANSGLSRIPLYGEHRDDIVGVLYAKDLFARLVDGEPPERVRPRKLVRAALFVPETKNATELLEEFRHRRVQMAIVLDEYGSVSGLITLEDLLEEVVGPIDDEHDAPTPEDPVVEVGDCRYEVNASVPLEDLNDRLDLDLPTNGDFQTVGGLAFDAIGRVPEIGATFRSAGVEFTVLEVVDHAIRKLRINLKPSTEPVGH